MFKNVDLYYTVIFFDFAYAGRTVNIKIVIIPLNASVTFI